MNERRILLAVGDPQRREVLSVRLQRANSVALMAESGRQAIDMLREHAPDMTIVDCHLHDMAVVELVTAMRAESALPILVLTDPRTNWQDSLRVLSGGASNTLHESRFGELEAQIDELLRDGKQLAITHGSIVLDKSAGTAEFAGRPLDLTSFEFKVLTFLVTRAADWTSAQTIADHLYREEYDRIPSVAAEFVRRLTKKMDPDGSRSPISTSEFGYRLVVTQPSGNDQ
jgi:two-component system response regulator PhoP